MKYKDKKRAAMRLQRVAHTASIIGSRGPRKSCPLLHSAALYGHAVQDLVSIEGVFPIPLIDELLGIQR